jgi:hypothetical protein
MRLLWRRKRASGAGEPARGRDARPELRVCPTPGAPVEVQIVGPNSIDVLRARDVSQNGVGVFVPHRFEGCEIDSDVQLVITLPGVKTFLARGVIRHVTGRGRSGEYFGVQFTEISERHRDELHEYIERTLAEQV